MHVMIDLETLSIRQDAHILEIAAVPFTEEAVMVDRSFHAYVKDDQPGRFVDNSTLLWWLTDGESGAGIQARQTLIQGLNDHGMSLASALGYLGVGLYQLEPEGCTVWAHGAVFDLGILRDAYAKDGRTLPWSYRNERDSRTALALSYLKDEKDHWIYEHDAEGLLGTRFVKHCALHDAVAEALRVQGILR